MKAVVYKGPFKLAVEDVEDPKIEQPGDAVIRVTTANICGSDLHPYEGRPRWRRAWCSGTRTWASSRRSGPG
jgi:glutathione-independent formaldehyde dehydrogenase